MITVDQALKIVLANIGPPGTETAELDQALGRVLAEDVRADLDLPPFDRARMDGFAVRSADVAAAPVTLRVIGEVAAGASFDGDVGTGQAVKIFTGAPMPHGADAVQMIEVTTQSGDAVLIKEPVAPGQFVTPRASEVEAGKLIAEQGREIGPAEMSVLASFGYAAPRIAIRPRVAVLSTGSELVEVSAKPHGAQIRNSNSYTIAAYAAEAGAAARSLGTIRDTPEATRRALQDTTGKYDLVITSGGVSMGDYDLVKGALVELGAEIFFDKVAIRPGKPTVFARLDSTYYFGLPGNPVSTSVTFNVFARPAIRKLLGDRDPLLPTVRAIAARDVKDSSNRRSYLPGLLKVDQGRALVTPLKWGGSSDFVAFMTANALIVVHEETHEISQGEAVDTLLLSVI
jgi:molybdenum cofactor synthesis domain-containing protein